MKDRSNDITTPESESDDLNDHQPRYDNLFDRYDNVVDRCNSIIARQDDIIARYENIVARYENIVARYENIADEVVTERDNAVAALRAIHQHHQNMAAVFNDDSVRWSAYRECQGVVETKARDHRIDLGDTTSRHEA